MQHKEELTARERKQIMNKQREIIKSYRTTNYNLLKMNDPIKYEKNANSRKGGVSRWRI